MRLRRSFWIMIAAVLAVFLLIACSGNRRRDMETSPGHGLSGKTYALNCPNGVKLTAWFDDSEVWLFLPVGYLTLPYLPNTAAVKFSDGQNTLWVNGEKVILELGGKSLGDCVNDPEEAVWEEARIRGVDFRAAGDGSGWILEITEGKSIVFVKGDERYRFPASKPKVISSNSRTTYRVKKGPHRFAVDILPTKCLDPKTGKDFQARVIISFDGKQFEGCGKALQQNKFSVKLIN